MIKDLFSNFTILVTTLFLYTQITQSSPLGRDSSVRRKVVAGVLAGILSNILMQYSMSFDSTIIDLRHIPILLVAFYGGSIPAVTATILVILGRFIIGVNASSIAALFLITCITVAAIVIFNSRFNKRTQIFLSLTVSNIIFTVVVVYLLKDLSILPLLIMLYWSISYAAGFVSFWTVAYIRDSQQLMNRFKLEANTDGLTGLNNVRQFDQLFNHLCTQAEKKQEHLSLLFIDIDHFKQVNDTYGHNEGDLVLMELSNVLRHTVRSFDIVSRNGGEEFTVILLDCSFKKAQEISERVRNKVEQHPFELSTGAVIKVTISIGLASYRETTRQPTLLLQDADQALYQAKQTGINKVCYPAVKGIQAAQSHSFE